uniref:Conotoxin Lt5.10 n=1 Tax=Conus litteratus TaxID=89445 RepID=CT5A_CONLT|nr:RecName: Full=Conotoxin Lt5.10; AltName: Full=Lt5j; Flags: Precursor [Conus litteratus]ABC70199.1 T-superfamily conotoxin lt5j precursor [Conus litteratus]
MLCLPVFIILLLLASPAAPKSLETRIQNDLIRAGLTDADLKTEKGFLSGLLNVAGSVCCKVDTSCCSSQ